MKKSFKAILSLTLAVFLLVCALPDAFVQHSDAASSEEIKKEIQALESKLEKAKEQKSSLSSEINRKKNEASGLEREIAALDAEMTAISEQLDTIEQLVIQWETQKELKEKEIELLEEEERQQREKFERMLRMSYEYGSDSYMELIFGAENFGDFLARIDLISYHLSYNNKIMDVLSETKSKVQKSRDDYEQTKASIEEYKEEQMLLREEHQEKSRLAIEKKAELLNSLSSLQAKDDLINDEIDNLFQESMQLSEALKVALANESGATVKSDGTFIWPLPSGYKYISSGFVNRINPVHGKKEFHNGIDIPAPSGTKIYAAASGTVVIARWNGGFGNCVTINHGNGFVTLYGHCSSLNVTAGQVVVQGDVIGGVGTTGISTGNHLHFTIYKNGVAVNPSDYVS